MTVAVYKPRSELTENFVVSGLWFHSHCALSDVPEKLTVPVSEGSVCCVIEYGYDEPQPPLTVVNVGKPSLPQTNRAKDRNSATGIRIYNCHMIPRAAFRIKDTALVRISASRDGGGDAVHKNLAGVWTENTL